MNDRKELGAIRKKTKKRDIERIKLELGGYPGTAGNKSERRRDKERNEEMKRDRKIKRLGKI